MRHDWRAVKLADVATEVTVGFVGSMVHEYVESGIPFLRSQNIAAHRVDMTDIKYISPEFHARLSKSALRPGDVATVRTGRPGTTTVVPAELAIANCSDLVITRPGPELNARWFAYYMNSVASHHVSAHAVGAVQQHFNVQSAKQMPILLPPVPEQRAIADVLGALDDKIAANSKLAQNALSLADTTFEATVGALVMSDYTFEMLATVSGGGTPSTKVDEYWNGAVAWATPTDVTGLPGPYLAATSRKITPEGLQACASKLFEPGAILMTSRATIGSFAINEVPTAVNQGFIVVEPNESVLRYWLLHEMRSRVPEFLSWANGATFLELSRGKFKKLPVRLPSDERLAHFDASVAPLHGVASAAHSESRTLAATRDALLPHLMSGRLTVRDAEKTVEDLV